MRYFIYTVVGRSNNNVSIDVANSGKYNIKNVKEPNQGKVGDVVHRFTLEEIMDLSPFKDHWFIHNNIVCYISNGVMVLLIGV
jgi:hypothetical protein